MKTNKLQLIIESFIWSLGYLIAILLLLIVGGLFLKLFLVFISYLGFI